MRYRQLAPGIAVSAIGFGNWTVTTGWWGRHSEDAAADCRDLSADELGLVAELYERSFDVVPVSDQKVG